MGGGCGGPGTFIFVGFLSVSFWALFGDPIVAVLVGDGGTYGLQKCACYMSGCMLILGGAATFFSWQTLALESVVTKEDETLELDGQNIPEEVRDNIVVVGKFSDTNEDEVETLDV